MITALLLLVFSAPSTLAQVDGYLQNRDESDPPRVDINQLQQEAFIMGNGEAYRDLLTIGASQAVAEFALRHERAEKYTVRSFYAYLDCNECRICAWYQSRFCKVNFSSRLNITS